MKASSYVACALACAVIMLHPTAAQAQSGCGAADPDCSAAAASALSTTTVLYIALPITAIGAIVWGVISTVQNANRNAAPRAAELYLRQNSLQLAQDLSSGSGPMLNDLAAALEIRKEHVKDFKRTLRTHRTELLALADTTRLNEQRAAEFFRVMTKLLEKDPQLGADYQGFLAHQATLSNG